MSYDEQKPMLLIGLRTHFFGTDSEKNNVAEQLPQLWGRFVPRLGEVTKAVPGTCYGVIRQEADGSERLEYHAAIEVTDAASIPDGMVALEIPAAKYARFEHRGPAQNLDHTVSYAYATWLAASPNRHSYGPDLEFYGPGYHPTSADSVIHYALPIA